MAPYLGLVSTSIILSSLLSTSVLAIPAGSSPAAAGTSKSSAPTSSARPVNCQDGTWDTKASNYVKFETDSELKLWFSGGKDADGITYPKVTGPFVDTLASDFLQDPSQFRCNLEDWGCTLPDSCEDGYSYRTGSSGQLVPLHWVYFVLHAIRNVWNFAHSLNDAGLNSGIYLANINLDLTKTFSKPDANPDIILKDVLLGFSFAAAAGAALIPVIGPGLDVAAASIAIGSSAIGTAGGFLGNAIAGSSNTLTAKAAKFGEFVATTFTDTQKALDDYVAQLMSGQLKSSDNSPAILGFLQGGAWVDQTALDNPKASISSLSAFLQRDLVQRGINHIWSQSKIWVTFADLGDDASYTKCTADRNGWQASKTCLDGGVYYLYRFNENGDHQGHLSYPWGADQMAADPWKLNPSWVTLSSARSFRAINKQIGGFDYNHANVPATLPNLAQSIVGKGSLDDLAAMEGVWTLPVCDMGKHSDWNSDFTATIANADNAILPNFPCCCGPNCSQTKNFIQAAQMNNFDTIHDRCKAQLRSCAAWPPGVTEIDFGDSGKITQNKDSNGNCQ